MNSIDSGSYTTAIHKETTVYNKDKKEKEKEEEGNPTTN
jgi:hypothetical protein